MLNKNLPGSFTSWDNINSNLKMKIGIIILMSILLTCSVGFAKSTGTLDTGNMVKSAPKIVKSVPLMSVKNTKVQKVEETPKGKPQAKDALIEPITQSLESKKSDTLIGYVSSIKQQLGRQESELQHLRKIQEESNKSILTWDKILMLVLTFLVLGLLIFFFVDKDRRRDEILFTLTGKVSNNETHRLLEWKNEIIEEAVERLKQIPPSIPSSKSNNSELELTISDLQTRIAALEDVSRKKTEEHSRKAEEPSKPVITVPSSKTLYADAIINGELNKVTEQPNDDTVYELFLKDQANKTAEITIYRDAYRRVIETPDFIEGCEKQRINNTPNNLQVEKGDAQMQDNGKWQIIKRVSVKFI